MKLIFVRIFLLLSIIALFLNSCSTKKSTIAEKVSLDSLKLADTSFHSNDRYYFYIVNSLVLKPENDVNNRINKSMIFEIFDVETDSYQQAFEKSFEEQKEMYMDTFSEMTSIEKLESRVDVNKLLFTKTVKSFSIYKYSYTGGAHGNYSTSLMNFDVNGYELMLRDITTDIEMLTNIGRQEFYSMFDLDKEKPINKQGYWFDRDEFYLPDNFAFTEDYLLFVYNPYEVASYAQGEIELRLPYSKIEKLINTELIPNN